MKNIIAIVQARITSTRLPQKVLKILAGEPVLTQVFNQLSYSKLVTNIVLATSDDPNDDPLEKWAIDNNHNYFRGDLNNVLKRFYDTAVKFNAKVIVRITGDCPLIDPQIVDEVIKEFLSGNYDYVSNTNPPTFPDGLDTEVFSFAALEQAYQNATLLSEAEHVTPYIKNNSQLFKIGNYFSNTDFSFLRWTLDNQEDYEFLKKVFDELGNIDTYISYKSVIELLKSNPELENINKHIKRNEGFLKSLKEDKNIGSSM